MDKNISIICDYIRRAAGNIPSVHHFLAPYDCYEGRIFEVWELEIIFEGNVPRQVFVEIAESNQEQERSKSPGFVSRS